MRYEYAQTMVNLYKMKVADVMNAWAKDGWRTIDLGTSFTDVDDGWWQLLTFERPVAEGKVYDHEKAMAKIDEHLTQLRRLIRNRR